MMWLLIAAPSWQVDWGGCCNSARWHLKKMLFLHPLHICRVCKRTQGFSQEHYFLLLASYRSINYKPRTVQDKYVPGNSSLLTCPRKGKRQQKEAGIHAAVWSNYLSERET